MRRFRDPGARGPRAVLSVVTTAVALSALAPLTAPSVVRAQVSQEERAASLFEEGQSLYRQGNFEDAAQRFHQAYAAYPEPSFLYNEARALEGLSSVSALRRAGATYRRYLQEATDIEDRPAIERRISAIDAQVRAMSQGSTTAPPTDEPRPAAEFNVVPWIVAGVGVVGALVGIPLGVMALDRHNAAPIEEDPETGQPSHRHAYEVQQQAYDLATGANVAFIVGGVLAATGVVWGVVSIVSSAPSRSERAQLRIAPTGMQLEVQF